MTSVKHILEELELRIADPEMNGRMPLKVEMMRHWQETLGEAEGKRLLAKAALNDAAEAFGEYEEHHLAAAMNPSRGDRERLESLAKAVRNKVLAGRCRSAAL